MPHAVGTAAQTAVEWHSQVADAPGIEEHTRKSKALSTDESSTNNNGKCAPRSQEMVAIPIAESEDISLY